MTLSLEQLSARMRQGEDIPLSDTARIALALSIPSILEQLVVTAMEYIDAAMVGHIGAEATAAIGIVSSSTWLLHGILVGLYTAFSIQIAQYLGADRRQDARGVLRQSMLFNLILGLGAAAFGVGISRFLPGWLGADISLQADASAYFAIWSAALPFTMAMGMYTAMLRATGDALTPSLISVLVCLLDVVFNFFLINPTRQILLFGQSVTVWGAGRIVSVLGTVAIAANSLGVSAEGLCYMAGYGIQDASIALIGQAVGAHRRDMAKRFAWLCTMMGIGIMALSGVGLWLFAPALMGIFTADAAVIALGAQVLRIEAFAEPMFGASIVASGAMQGAGDSTGCFLLNLFSMWGVRLTLAFLLAPRLGLVGVWAAMCIELCIRGALFLIRLARGKWLDKGALQ